jgi:hypothetical protein
MQNRFNTDGVETLVRALPCLKAVNSICLPPCVPLETLCPVDKEDPGGGDGCRGEDADWSTPDGGYC